MAGSVHDFFPGGAVRHCVGSGPPTTSRLYRMTSNLDRFKKDLAALISKGESLQLSIQYEALPVEFEELIRAKLGTDAKVSQFLKAIPKFKVEYQSWYSEALALLRQLLPDRVADFVRHYEKPKTRKEVRFESYRIEDFLQGLTVTNPYTKQTIAGPSAAIPHFDQQLAMVKAAQARFESSLFDIRQLVHADLLDSELDTAELLAKHRFVRAAGAVAGVVLERHLGQVCRDRALTLSKKNPTISDFNEALKAEGAIDVPQWRFVQHLADIRNLCDHSKDPEPTKEQVADLLAGTKKVVKTIF